MGVLSFYRMGCCENDSKIAISNKILQKQVKKRPTCTSLYSPRVSFSHLSGPSEWAWVKGLFIEMLCILKAHIQSVSHFLHHRKRVGLCNQSNNEFGPLLCITAEADSSVPFNWPRRYYTDITRLPCTDINRDSFFSQEISNKLYDCFSLICLDKHMYGQKELGQMKALHLEKSVWARQTGLKGRPLWLGKIKDNTVFSLNIHIFAIKSTSRKSLPHCIERSY